jgi:hypothetical protein
MSSTRSDIARSQRMTAGTLAALPYANLATPFYSASQAKKGRKAAVGARTLGRTTLEGSAASIPAGALYALASRSGSTKAALIARLAGAVGVAGASAHGASSAMRNAQRRGDIGKSLLDVSKAWRGEQADKRNTKYVGAAAAGAFVGNTAVNSLPSSKRVNRARVSVQGQFPTELERYLHRNPSVERPGPMKHLRLARAADRAVPGRNALVQRGRMGALSGAALAAGGYGVYRAGKQK